MINKLINPLDWFGKYGLVYNIKWGILYRTVDRYNKIEIKSLKAGYYDADTRMLHGMFQLLTDYVEIELGYRQYWMDLKDSEDIIKSWSKYKRFYIWLLTNLPVIRRLFRPRFPQLGLRYNEFYVNYEEETLRESCKNEDEYKKYVDSWREFGKEVRDLYTWWKEVRPNRPDPMDVSGWSDLCDKYPLKFEKTEDGKFYRSKEESEEVDNLKTESCKKCYELEEENHKEDEEMLIRLIKIRRGLWT